MRFFYRAVWIGSLLAILGMSFVFLTQPLTLPIIAPLVAYVSDDKSMALQHPANWKVHESASHAVSAGVAFDPNANTHFAVESSFAGSLYGDIARTPEPAPNDSPPPGEPNLPGMPGAAIEAPDKRKSPLEMLHEASMDALEKNHSRFADFKPGATEPTQIGGVDALLTTFTYTRGNFLSKKEMVGTCVSLLTKDRGVTVFATSTQALQATLKPIFDQMIASIRLGQPGG